MDFELSDDQVALRDAARDLLSSEASPARVRAVVDAGGAPDARLWSAMVDQGWPAIAVPEADGGIGLTWVEAAVLAEQAGAHLAPAPIVQHLIALASLRDEALVAGASIATVAWSGRRELVPFASAASVAVAVVGDELHAVELDGSTPVEQAMDVTRQVGWLEPAAGRRIGEADAVAHHRAVGATLLAAELLGAAQHMLDESAAYAKDRVQFDKPIGSFQAVKHRLADMLVDVEGMRSAAYWAAWCLAADHPDALVAAATAKAWCSEAGMRVLQSALQVHGGIGFTWEHDSHLYLKRGELDAVMFGDATWHRSRLAELLRPKVAAGEPVL